MPLLVNFLFVVCHRSRLSLTKKQNFSRFIYPNLIASKMTDTFQGRVDQFNGVTVNSEAERCDTLVFGDKLDNSIKKWRDEGRRGVWFRVNLDQSEWVPILAKKGFRYHHASDSFVMMYLWLPAGESCNIPRYAHTMIGVGAVVVNDESEVLVVNEKYYKAPHWKLPGGYVEPGENLVDAAIREVWEETGVRTEFQTLLALRHGHFGMFGCSDIYVVIALKPLTVTIEKCEREIANCQWMGVDEYLNHPHIHELNRFFVQKYLEFLQKKLKIDWYHGLHQVVKKPYTVYFVTNADEEKNK